MYQKPKLSGKIHSVTYKCKNILRILYQTFFSFKLICYTIDANFQYIDATIKWYYFSSNIS